jgi:hypothetical protein
MVVTRKLLLTVFVLTGCASRQVTVMVQAPDGTTGAAPGEEAPPITLPRRGPLDTVSFTPSCADGVGLYSVEVEWNRREVTVRSRCAAPAGVVGDDQLDMDGSGTPHR